MSHQDTAPPPANHFAIFAPLVRENLVRICLAGVALLCASLATLAIPLAVRVMIDNGFTASNATHINIYFAALGAIVCALALSSGTRYYLVITLGETIIARLRSQLFTHLLTLDAQFYDREKTGELISRISADTTQLKSAFGASASIAVRNLLLFLGAITMMLATSVKLSSFVLLAIPMVVLPLVFSGRLVRQRGRNAQDRLADATAFATEFLAGVRVVQSFSAEVATGQFFTSASDEAYKAANIATRARAILTTLAIMLAFGSVVFVLWLGAQDVLQGYLSGGTLTQFVLYAAFGAGALGELSQVWSELSAARGAADRLAELLARMPTVQSPAQPKTLGQGVVAANTPALTLQNVSFAYPAAPDAPILQDLSLTIPRGAKIALVGPSGAGKTTLFQLLMRFYDPLAGTILLDGVALPDYNLAALRKNFAIVPQEPIIFGTSILDNLRLGRPDAPLALVKQAAKDAAADGFIEALPQGFDTIIGERGLTLSGGQRQRLAIARALLKDAPILLLDEATSAMDAENEALIQGALARLMAGRTSLVIAHRLATVRDADKIVVMDKGRVVESGTHEDLMVGGGLYARLAHLQFL